MVGILGLLCLCLFVIPPYGSMGILSLLCVCLFVFLFVCTVTDFLAGGKW